MFNAALKYQYVQSDIGDWNTSAVVKMNDMFYNANDLTNLHSWDDMILTVRPGRPWQTKLPYILLLRTTHWTTDWSSFIGSTPLTDSNFQSALNTWFSDEAYAIATYGHIGDWNTSAVTNMSAAFSIEATSTRTSVTGMSVMSQTSLAYLRVQNLLINRLETGIPLRLPLSILFSREPSFNQPIGNWDTSRVASFTYLLKELHLSTNPSMIGTLPQ